MRITKTSILTGKKATLDLPITKAQLAAFEAGAMVQNAFPNLEPAEREFILNGITPEEWDQTFGALA